MKTLILTNEYPPNIYGGAGVHVENLSEELAKLCQVEIRCFGNQKIDKKNLKVRGYKKTKHSNRTADAVERCVNFNANKIDSNVVHVHTWYTHWGGILTKLNQSIPLVVTIHSLEPLRPWKKEQLGADGYELSSLIEKTAIEMADAVIAVSEDTKKNVNKFFKVSKNRLHVIPNGIDPDTYKPSYNEKHLKSLGINPKKPFVLFVGRITRQKGIIHLVDAINFMDPDFQVVLCASAPDTKEIAAEMNSHIKKAKRNNPNIVWIEKAVKDDVKISLYSAASIFCCPSVYEPFGIINLEAMACETPVVASKVGGIKEVVEHGKTGILVDVPMKSSSLSEPKDPIKFSKDLARNINKLMKDEKLRKKMGTAGRKRVLKYFTWERVAKETLKLYKKLH
ncbi:MAG: glycogen synthase [Candidatus Zapsychrus exili]|nr:glycogen synthase [Candidatus Zapsychrus exili]